jgi:hypothetical protein
MSKSPLISGYREQYDPEPALIRLASDREAAISELWENLYHQGDVDTASYYSTPALVKAGELSLVAAIEVARHEPQNPPIPETLKENYDAALVEALKSHPVTEEEYRGFYIIHAATHGQMKLAKAMDLMDVSEILETYS